MTINSEKGPIDSGAEDWDSFFFEGQDWDSTDA